MDAKYFPGTDTLLIGFSDREIVETRDIGEDLLIELDGDGKIVSLTVEHAGEHIDVSKLSYDQVPDSRGGLISRRTEALC
ncbi:MAG: DUF2283 domain-containing protein [Caldilineaceae bacterium SB0665_bin_25]|nr:DUF2283 domain-containing protein [Caldilineaceae bacterium SB0665_bin_25]